MTLFNGKPLRKPQTAIPEILNPTMLKTAKDIYDSYRRYHRQSPMIPMGVAIDSKTNKGQLVFKYPILLPWENFIPIEKISA